MQVWLNGAKHDWKGARGKSGKPSEAQQLGHGISVTSRELPQKKILDEPVRPNPNPNTKPEPPP